MRTAVVWVGVTAYVLTVAVGLGAFALAGGFESPADAKLEQSPSPSPSLSAGLGGGNSTVERTAGGQRVASPDVIKSRASSSGASRQPRSAHGDASSALATPAGNTVSVPKSGVATASQLTKIIGSLRLVAPRSKSVQTLNQGLRIASFTINPGDRAPGDSASQVRAEYVSNDHMPFDRDVWLSDSINIQKYDYEPGKKYVVLDQFRYTNDKGDRSSLSPDFAVVATPENDSRLFGLSVVTRSDPSAANTDVSDTGSNFGPWISANDTGYGGSLSIVTPASVQRLSMKELKGTWIRLVAKIRFSRGRLGHLVLWLNGSQVFAASIPIGYDRQVGPVFHYGAYADPHAKSIVVLHGDVEFGTVDLSKRVSGPLPLP